MQASDSELYATTKQSTLGERIGNHGISSSDLWSVAYREAVETLGKGIDIAILDKQTRSKTLTFTSKIRCTQ